MIFTIQNGPDLQKPISFFKKLIELLQISLTFQYKINFFLSDVALAAPGLRSLACRLGSPWAPCIYPDFERYPPKWFSAITCAIWLRLIFRGRGSAWFFGAHLLFFHARDGFWRPGSDFGTPRSTFWPAYVFWGPEKDHFAEDLFGGDSGGSVLPK